jgi:hypothetical protein
MTYAEWVAGSLLRRPEAPQHNARFCGSCRLLLQINVHPWLASNRLSTSRQTSVEGFESPSFVTRRSSRAIARARAITYLGWIASKSRRLS